MGFCIQLIFLFFLALVFLSAAAQAQTCTLPDGESGVIVYNTDEATFQGCTAGGWYDLVDGSIPTLGSLDFDFTTQSYVRNGTSHTLSTLPGWSFSRASPATSYAEDEAGNLISFAANAPQITDKGLLIEGERTNINTHSQELDNTTGWGHVYVTVQANATNAPDGTPTAEKLVDTTDNNRHWVISKTGIVNIPDHAVASVYAKKAEKDKVVVGVYWTSGVAASGIIVDLNDCSYVGTWARSPGNISGTLVSSRPVANDFCHIQAYINNITDAFSFRTIIGLTNATGNAVNEVYAGDGTSGIYVWGVQTEVQSGGAATIYNGTSYIPTGATAVTRNADAAKLTTSGWFNRNEGTFIAKGLITGETGTSALQAALGLGTAENDSFWQLFTSDNRRNIGFISPGFAFDASYHDMTNKEFSVAGSYSNSYSTSQGVLDGELGDLFPGNIANNSVTHISIGSMIRNLTFYHPMYGYVKQLHYRPLALSDTELQDATDTVPVVPDPPDGCTAPEGVPGEIIYNIDHDVFQGCTPSGWVALHEPTNLRNGLVGHWRLDEESGTLVDSSGNGNDGTASGGPTYGVEGQVGRAMEFDGVDDDVEANDSGTDLGSDYSMSMWFKPNTLPQQGALLSIGNGTWNGSFNIGLANVHFNSAASSLTYREYNDAGEYRRTQDIGSLTAGQWHLLSVVSRNADLRIYLNGTLTSTHSAVKPSNPFSPNVVTIGKSSTGQSPFNGLIDDVRIYNRDLGEDEIATLAAMGQCADPEGVPGVIAYNEDYNVFQGCTPSGWMALHDIPDDPCNQSPTPGTTCLDGSIYAGESPDGDVPMFTTAADAGTYSWNDGAGVGDRTETNITNTLTGSANTVALLTIDSDSSEDGDQPHIAAETCHDLVSGGHKDWYLPAIDELTEIYENLYDQDGDDIAGGPLGSTFNFQGGWYWSSSEASSNNANNAIAIDFSTQNTTGRGKSGAYNVRCVRKN